MRIILKKMNKNWKLFWKKRIRIENYFEKEFWEWYIHFVTVFAVEDFVMISVMVFCCCSRLFLSCWRFWRLCLCSRLCWRIWLWFLLKICHGFCGFCWRFHGLCHGLCWRLWSWFLLKTFFVTVFVEDFTVFVTVFVEDFEQGFCWRLLSRFLLKTLNKRLYSLSLSRSKISLHDPENSYFFTFVFVIT